jgi:hypothetical protein
VLLVAGLGGDSKMKVVSATSYLLHQNIFSEEDIWESAWSCWSAASYDPLIQLQSSLAQVRETDCRCSCDSLLLALSLLSLLSLWEMAWL